MTRCYSDRFVILICLVGLNALFVILSASEVSINLKCALNFFGFFANAQNDKGFGFFVF